MVKKTIDELIEENKALKAENNELIVENTKLWLWHRHPIFKNQEFEKENKKLLGGI
tara:strand:+ start:64 stop:231 length:168 start_codon:yes stop_codon:yes gene_type:complete